MKIGICTINLNEEEGRQTIYWNTEDKLLYTDYDDSEAYGVEQKTIEEAQETAHALWGTTPGWDLEWIENDGPAYDRDTFESMIYDFLADHGGEYEDDPVILDGEPTVYNGAWMQPAHDSDWDYTLVGDSEGNVHIETEGRRG